MKKISLQPVDHNTETQAPLSILREDLRIGQELIGRLLKMGFWMHSRTAQGATMRDRKAKNRLPARESDLGFRLHPDEDSRTSEVLIDDSDSWRQ
jgi:hypothetical protein